jgi:hypothetical protein
MIVYRDSVVIDMECPGIPRQDGSARVDRAARLAQEKSVGFFLLLLDIINADLSGLVGNVS